MLPTIWLLWLHENEWRWIAEPAHSEIERDRLIAHAEKLFKDDPSQQYMLIAGSYPQNYDILRVWNSFNAPRENYKPYSETPMKGTTMQNETLNTIKTVTGLIAEYGSGIIIGRAIQTNVPTKNAVDKTAVAVGSVAMGGLVGKHVRIYTDQTFDEIAKIFKNRSQDTK